MVRRLFVVLVILGVLGFAGWKVMSQTEYWLYALDAVTGKLVWSTHLPNSKRSTSIPFTAEGRLYVGLVTGTDENDKREEAISLNAYDTQTGEELWSFTPDHTQFPRQDSSTWYSQTPYALNNLAFMTMRSTNDDQGPILLAIDAVTGKLRWSLDHTFEREQGGIPEVAMAGGKLIVLQWKNDGGTFTYVARVIDPQTGKVLQDLVSWNPDELGSFQSFYDPFVHGSADALFILTDKAIYAFDAATGTRKFSLDIASARYAVSEDGIFVRRPDTISAYDLKTGEQRWTYTAETFQHSRNYFNWITAGHGTVQVMCNCAEDDAGDGTAVYVFDAQTGALRFSRGTSKSSLQTYFQRAVAAKDVILAAVGRYGNSTELSGIVALDSKDGSLRWQFVTAPTRLKAPATDGNRVFVTALDTRLRAWLTPMNSEWRFSVGVDAP